MALTSWNEILNKPKGVDEVPEIALTVEQLSASVTEIALEVSQLSASKIPFTAEGFQADNTKDAIIEAASSSNYDYMEFSIAPGSTLINQNSTVDFTSSETIPAGKDIKGYIPLYAGSVFCGITKVVKNSSDKLVVTVCNLVGSGKTTDGNITGILILKDTLTQTRKTTKKK